MHYELLLVGILVLHHSFQLVFWSFSFVEMNMAVLMCNVNWLLEISLFPFYFPTGLTPDALWWFKPNPPYSSNIGRTRLNSESHTSTASRDEEFQGRGEDDASTPTDGAPFRGRSKSAPPALWAAKKYGQKLRRMSDEFDSLLDKGVRMRGQRMKEGFKTQDSLWTHLDFIISYQLYLLANTWKRRGTDYHCFM